MRRCRKCNTEWPDTVSACPNDGWSLTLDLDATVAARNVPVAPPSASTAIVEPSPPIARERVVGDLAPGSVVGEYRVEGKIGEGGMGAVYAAMHPMIGKRAAIKVISAALGTNAEAIGRFIQEARSANQIGHPNIVDVFAFGELADGRNYFVMEYLQGESLAARLERAPMPLGEAIEILDQVADALDAAHEKQIVHRDLKPDNVYLAAVRGGRTLVKLLDFGIAKLSVSDAPGSGGIAKTRTGMMMGTPGYLSPEQARGRNVDHRTDIYALGCMTFEIVCGRLPYLADNAMDIVFMHMNTPAPRASSVWPDVPAPLDALIAGMLEKDPAARPSLAQVRAVFSELVTTGLVTLSNGHGIAFGSGIGRAQTPGGGMPRPQTQVLAVGTSPRTTSPSEYPVAPPRSKTGLVVALLAVLAVGGAAAVLLARGGDRTAPAAPSARPTPPAPQLTPSDPKPPVTTTPEPAAVAPTPAPEPPAAAPAPVPEPAVAAPAPVPEPAAPAHVAEPTPPKRTTTAAKSTAKTTTKKPASKTSPPEGAGSGSAKKPATYVDKNAPIDPF